MILPTIYINPLITSRLALRETELPFDPPKAGDSWLLPSPADDPPSVLLRSIDRLWVSRSHLLKYSPTQATDKTVEGRFGFIAQLNPARFNKRATEFKMDAVVQPFDAAKFNFTKAAPEESMVQLKPDTSLATDVSVGQAGPADDPASTVVMINISPIAPLHLLLLPNITARLPQQTTAPGIQSGLEFLSVMGTDRFRLGYNSLGAYASVNHLHLQGYYHPGPMAIEGAEFQEVPGIDASQGVTLHLSSDYPVRTLEYRSASPAAFPRAAAAAAALCKTLEARNQPYNLYITSQGRRLFVIPNRFEAAKIGGEVSERLLETGMNPATFEIAGHILMKRQEDWEGFTEEDCLELLRPCSIGEGAFGELAKEAVATLA